MLAGALILGGADDEDSSEDLNVQAALPGTAADTAAAARVAASGAIIRGAGRWYWPGPSTALIIGKITVALWPSSASP